MRVVVDTNVVLDFLLAREPFGAAAADLAARIFHRQLEGFLCATTVSTIAYFGQKALESVACRRQLQDLLLVFRVAPVDGAVLLRALAAQGPDFEDVVLYEAARGVEAEAIVTRDPGGFRGDEIPRYSPTELLALLDLEAR